MICMYDSPTAFLLGFPNAKLIQLEMASEPHRTNDNEEF